MSALRGENQTRKATSAHSDWTSRSAGHPLEMAVTGTFVFHRAWGPDCLHFVQPIDLTVTRPSCRSADQGLQGLNRSRLRGSLSERSRDLTLLSFVEKGSNARAVRGG